MGYPIANFQILNPDQANPFGYGMMQGSKIMQTWADTLATQLANQKNKDLLPYVVPQAQATLQTSQLTNQKSVAESPYWGDKAAADLVQQQIANQKSKMEASQYEKQLAIERNLKEAQTKQAAAQASVNAFKLNQASGGTNNAPTYVPNNYDNGNSTGITNVGQTANTVMPPQPANQNGMQEQSTYNQPVQNNQVDDDGIPNAQITPDDYRNSFAGGNSAQAKIDSVKQLRLDQRKAKNDSTQKAIDLASSSNQSYQTLMKFGNAYDNSYFKGPTLGPLAQNPISKALLGVFHDFTPENSANRMAYEEVLPAIAQVKNSMQAGQFSATDMNVAQGLKYDIKMEPEEKRLLMDQVGAINNRNQSISKFWGIMNNPKTGLTDLQTKLLANSYANNNPVFTINKDGKVDINNKNNYMWTWYTTKAAIDSVKKTGTYKPDSKLVNNYTVMVTPDNQMIPIKNSMLKEAIQQFNLRLP